MAIAMRTFGNTLSDLQAGTNADKGLDYQRANAQDAINQQRLEAFMRLQGQKFQTQARQNEMAAERAQRMAELLQQNSQFKLSEENRLKLGEMEAQSRRDAAKAAAEGRVNPQLEGLKMEFQQEEVERKALSDARRKIVEEMRGLEQWKAGNLFDFGDPNDIGSRWTSKRYGELRDALVKMDADAKALNLTPSGYGGYAGYDVETPNLPVIRPGATAVNPPAAVPPMIPVAPAPAPAQTGAAYMGLGGMLPSAAIRAPSPVPNLFDTSIPSLRPQGATNRFRWTPNGAVAY